MCGRFTLHSSPASISEQFGLKKSDTAALKPRYNIAPSQPIAAVVQDPKRRLEYLNWGLVPSWAKDPSIGFRMINARAETLVEKPSFRSSFKSRRCLILADGFYEWKQESASRTPIYIQLADKKPFAFAGLWAIWLSPDGSQIASCTIITTTPNKTIEQVHHRMPVILPPRHYEEWLDISRCDHRSLQDLLKPYPAKETHMYPVSKLVNSPRNDKAECLKSL
jgi:putative SOS response-associated peptidase YedK